MKRLLPILFLIFTSMVSAQVERIAPPVPVPPRLVNDFTGNFLTADQKAALENKLKLYDDSTSNQVTVVIVNDLKGYAPADYAMAIGREWGVGNKKFDNGIVLLVSTGGGEGRRAVFIAVGYGLEGVVTDLVARSIVENDIIPGFKAGNFYRGLDQGTDAIIHAAEGRYTAPEGYASRGKKKISPFTIIVIIIIMIIFFSMISRGGSGGGYVSRRGYRGWDGPGRGGYWGGWTGGGGGGGWSGGGGGGFGGFGGGSFGGGGAGGSW